MPKRIVLLGTPVSQSVSPLFQNAAIRAAGIDARYEALEVTADALESVVAGFRHDAASTTGTTDRTAVAGNVTIPHKARFAELCDRLSPIASRVAAVNTFWFEDDSLVGDNTDVRGFSHAVRHLLGAVPRRLTIGVIGAGGAAAAVVAAVEEWEECHVLLWNRTVDRAEELAARFRSVARVVDAATLAEEADLVVNAIPVSRDSGGVEGSPIDVQRLERARAVLDLVHQRGGTSLVHAARARGLAAADGLEMLLEQGALAFERWFGVEPDRQAMRGAVDGR
jgi:shikimate dehydrogenase